MAKGNMLLGYARGSVGDLTFYRRNAQQITRARARQVKNPKTLSQQMQRAIMRTGVAAYQVLKEICDHSWEGIAYGADSYSYFLKRNLAMLRDLAAVGGQDTKSFLPSGFNGLVAMPWVLSKGSISWNGYVRSGFGLQISSSIPQAATLSTITYAQLATLMGLQQGDQITFIWAPQRNDVDESNAMSLIVARLILSPKNGEFAETNVFDASGKINDGNILNENMNAITFSVERGEALIATADGFTPNDSPIGAAIIISRRASDGAWLRSSETLDFDGTHRDGGYTLRQASMVAATEIQTPSDWYLNNANEIQNG